MNHTHFLKGAAKHKKWCEHLVSVFFICKLDKIVVAPAIAPILMHCFKLPIKNRAGVGFGFIKYSLVLIQYLC